MDTRDFFAGCALVGLLAAETGLEIGECASYEDNARQAHDFAQAMMAEREKREGQENGGDDERDS